MKISHKCIINVVVVYKISRLSTYFLCLVNETDYQQKMSLNGLFFRTHCHPLHIYNYIINALYIYM